MTDTALERSRQFRRLHDPGQLLVLANAWDAGSARLIESCGATAIATTSAGLAWAAGYPDGNALPRRALLTAISTIARLLSVPLTADIEAGYSSDPDAVSELVATVLEAGAVGINIEDGAESPDLLARKITAAKTAAARTGIDLFINARTDVYLRGLVPAERALDETLQRAQLYQAAGCDGLFVPRLADPESIRRLTAAVTLPVNLMVVPGLPSIAELRTLGVRRVSAGSAIAQAAYATAKRAATQLLDAGNYDPMFELTIPYVEMNALYASAV